MARIQFPGKILAEKGKKGIFSTKIWTWTTMPLKVGFIPGFRGLVTDCSLPGNGKKGISRLTAPRAKETKKTFQLSKRINEHAFRRKIKKCRHSPF
jgi:hypothetical protein